MGLHAVATHSVNAIPESEIHMDDPIVATRGYNATPEATPVAAPRGKTAPASVSLAVARPAAPAEQPTPTTFRDRLGGRVLIVTGDDAAQYSNVISSDRSGLVVGGKNAYDVVRRLAHADPTRLLAVDPWQSYTGYATAERPFILDTADDGQGSLFAPPTLEDHLSSQIALGAAFAVTPTGIIHAGDNSPLKAAVIAINKIQRSDIVLYAPMALACFQQDNLRSLIGILSKCEHPVAIAVADRNPDPYSKVLSVLRELVVALDYAIVWRTDAAGFDLMAHGAQAACIGAIPSKRAADTPGEKRFATDKRDMHPHVLRRELLRWVKTTFMVDNWYASLDAPGCSCVVCQGRRVDRYGDNDAARLEAHKHNVAVIMEIIESVPNPVGALPWWNAAVADAVAEHISLGAAIGGRVKVPASLDAYSRP
jgi:hypothetical protein